ncbi:MAG: glycosyltransferase family 4 protein [Armatimonadetes bacterium]|nr:glycosyltransferase family 4 protein [Armatimonadota bacterium]
MNIALFASAFYPHVGGVEELSRQLAHSLTERGHRVIILTNRWPRSLPEYEEFEGLPLYRLPMRVPEGSLKAHVSYRLTGGGIRRRMLEILRQHQVDLLHVQCISTNGYYAWLAAQALRLPLVATAQGELTMDAAHIYQRRTFMNAFLPRLLCDADFVTGCSEQTLAELRERRPPRARGQWRVVYNGVTAADFESVTEFSHPRPYVLGIGRLVPQKGFDVLMRAFSSADLAGIDLVIAGEGPEIERLRSLAQELGISERVLLFGRADRTQAAALFKGCHFFVLPSRHEPFGIVNLEAMAAGKAVVATRVGGVPEVVLDGETGLVVPREDEKALAGAMSKLANDEPLRERMGAAGRERARLFSWDTITEQYLEVYQEALGQNRA